MIRFLIIGLLLIAATYAAGTVLKNPTHLQPIIADTIRIN